MKHNGSQMKKGEFGYKVLILGNKCYRCEHAWIPREIEKKPSVCPFCKSPYWGKPREKPVKSKKNDK